MSRKRMTDAEFERWQNLIHYVVKNVFFWAYDSGSDRELKKYRRFLQYDDLFQEGAIGMLRAWKKYDPERGDAEFKTYAFRAIVNQINRYIDGNLTPVSISGWRKIQGNDDIRAKLRAAIGCSLFSELQVEDTEWMDVEDRRAAGDPTEPIESKEWADHCVGLLKKGIGSRRLNLLMHRFKGATLKAVGARRRVSRERARQVIEDSMILAVIALACEERNQQDD